VEIDQGLQGIAACGSRFRIAAILYDEKHRGTGFEFERRRGDIVKADGS
jgi:hypothetical protein